jgi:hypothetical protein
MRALSAERPIVIDRFISLEGTSMRNTRLQIAALCWLAVGSLALSGTTRREAGLWETTTTMTWQKAPQVQGAQGEKLRGGTHTSQVCLTQAMIDDYGALLPQSRGHCSIENKVVTAGKVTGDYVCSGLMTGRGQLLSTWADAEHVTGKVHFVGTFLVGSEPQPIEWTTETTSTFKSSSCGFVKPLPMPK